MQAAKQLPLSSTQSVQLHINCSIKNQLDHLINIKNIKPYLMSSASSDNDIKCTALGYLPWQSPCNDTLLVKEAGYVLEQTTSDSSFQNSMAEQPN
jgi:hypothetical protein